MTLTNELEELKVPGRHLAVDEDSEGKSWNGLKHKQRNPIQLLVQTSSTIMKQNIHVILTEDGLTPSFYVTASI
jgi:hypothetical protein